MSTVTVTRARPRNGQRVTLTFSRPPGREFGPYPWGEAITDLTTSALLSRMDARDLVLEALALGTATCETRRVTIMTEDPERAQA